MSQSHDMPEDSADSLGSPNPADDCAARWFDLEGSSDDLLERCDARRVADMALLNALLSEVHAPQPQQSRERRIAGVMQAISAPEREVGTEVGIARRAIGAGEAGVRRRSWFFSGLSVAAALAIMAAWYWSSSPSRIAHAAVDKAFRNASRLKDTQYRVTTELRRHDGRENTVYSTLYMRGNEMWALRHAAIFGDSWAGWDGQQNWFIPAVGLPQPNHQGVLTLTWSRHGHSVTLPDVHLTAVIDYLARDFDLRLLPNELLEDDADIYWQRVRGWKREPAADRPSVVDLWAHPATGVTRRMVLDWERPNDAVGICRITLDLVGEQPQDDSLYRAAGHPANHPNLPESLAPVLLAP